MSGGFLRAVVVVWVFVLDACAPGPYAEFPRAERMLFAADDSQALVVERDDEKASLPPRPPRAR
jgi:hypothetical protein